MRVPGIRLICAWFVLLTAGAFAVGIESIDMASSRFFADFATFRDGETNRIEVYYKIFNDGLHYVKKGDKYVANYEINVIVLGDGDQQVTAQSVDKTYVLNEYELTQSQQGFLVNQVDLTLKPGHYALVCKMIDHNSNDASTVETKLESPGFNPNGDLSDVQFIQEVDAVAGDSRFVKLGQTAVPAVERTFDNEEQKLGIYVEAYAAEQIGRELTLEWDIKSKHGNGEDFGDVKVPITGPAVGITDFISLTEMAPGEYELSLKLVDGASTLAERKTKFFIKWSMGSLIKNDFDYAVDQLKYVFSGEERDELKETPDSLRLEKFEELWKAKDPTPGSAQNELRDEYYRRIRYANQYFHAINREGWQTDRGMVYIKYGEPDQVDRHPFELERKPYQIWYYYSQRRTFVFEDSRGDGDYQLLYPFDGDQRYRLDRD
ncbi:MAG: GWxTD domain-containing protein [bacterium]